jgi:hypothetical protein
MMTMQQRMFSGEFNLDDFALASRLSYFLWSSMPDETLLAAADAGRLDDSPHLPQELEAHVERMLADPKAQALVDNFSGQWLHTRELDRHVPSLAVYPAYDPALREAMRAETQLTFREFLRSGVGADKLLTADFSFMNDRLAQHYGLPPVGSAVPVRVPTTPRRRGLLMHGSVLTVTSNGNRTSPTKRGAWVSAQLLCSPPAPPPPDTPRLVFPQREPTGSWRERLQQHAKDPKCSVCHVVIDPIGFGLEGFDGIGAERTEDNGFPIDTSGTLYTGESFTGPSGLADALSRDPRLMRCLTQQLYVYALARVPTAGDQDTLDRITRDFAARGHRLADLVKIIVAGEILGPRAAARGKP